MYLSCLKQMIIFYPQCGVQQRGTKTGKIWNKILFYSETIFQFITVQIKFLIYKF